MINKSKGIEDYNLPKAQPRLGIHYYPHIVILVLFLGETSRIHFMHYYTIPVLHCLAYYYFFFNGLQLQ